MFEWWTGGSRDRDAAVTEPLQACVLGPPERPAIDLAWRTADALGLARAIRAAGAFDRLPLLADALMEAGCEDERLLGHCRSGGPHLPGCWVVDLVLGPAAPEPDVVPSPGRREDKVGESPPSSADG